MKSYYVYMLILLVLQYGCDSHHLNLPDDATSAESVNTENMDSHNESDRQEWPPIPMPDVIVLTFNSLEMEGLQQGDASDDWQKVQTIPFGQIANHNAVMEIYEVNVSESKRSKQIHGILRFEDHHYLISNVSSSLLGNDSYNCAQVCIFQRYFSNQDRFQLIGSMDISTNGPGLKKYFIYDETLNELLTFDLWGEPGFIDLDGDGKDEFVAEFQGVGLSLPDLSMIRAVHGGLEISTSVFNAVARNPGDFAKLDKDQNPLVVSISNVESDNNPVYHYTYDQGILKMVESDDR